MNVSFAGHIKLLYTVRLLVHLRPMLSAQTGSRSPGPQAEGFASSAAWHPLNWRCQGLNRPRLHAEQVPSLLLSPSLGRGTGRWACTDWQANEKLRQSVHTRLPFSICVLHKQQGSGWLRKTKHPSGLMTLPLDWWAVLNPWSRVAPQTPVLYPKERSGKGGPVNTQGNQFYWSSDEPLGGSVLSQLAILTHCLRKASQASPKPGQGRKTKHQGGW